MKKILCLLFVIQLLMPLIFCQIRTQEDDYLTWLKQYENSKAKVRTGDTLAIMGILSSGLGTLLYFKDKDKTEYLFYSEEKSNPTYLIVIGAGIAMGIMSFVISEPARSEVRMLELEGAKKGYIKLSPYIDKEKIGLTLEIAF